MDDLMETMEAWEAMGAAHERAHDAAGALHSDLLQSLHASTLELVICGALYGALLAGLCYFLVDLRSSIAQHTDADQPFMLE